MGHGAGGGVGARDLVVLAEQLPRHGLTVVRMEQPWRVSGRRIAGSPPTLDEAWLSVLDQLGDSGIATARLVVGGRSAGARVAFRTAAGRQALGVLALGFPLHPPGRAERSRRHEISDEVPALIVQGASDVYGRPEEFADLPARVRLARIPGTDHGFQVRGRVPITQHEAEELIVDRCLDWLIPLTDREST